MVVQPIQADVAVTTRARDLRCQFLPQHRQLHVDRWVPCLRTRCCRGLDDLGRAGFGSASNCCRTSNHSRCRRRGLPAWSTRARAFDTHSAEDYAHNRHWLQRCVATACGRGRAGRNIPGCRRRCVELCCWSCWSDGAPPMFHIAPRLGANMNPSCG